jgi:hypothetical protein
MREREREREWRGNKRHYILGQQQTILLVLKVPRQCRLVLQVEVIHKIGIILHDVAGDAV